MYVCVCHQGRVSRAAEIAFIWQATAMHHAHYTRIALHSHWVTQWESRGADTHWAGNTGTPQSAGQGAGGGCCRGTVTSVSLQTWPFDHTFCFIRSLQDILWALFSFLWALNYHLPLNQAWCKDTGLSLLGTRSYTIRTRPHTHFIVRWSNWRLPGMLLQSQRLFKYMSGKQRGWYLRESTLQDCLPSLFQIYPYFFHPSLLSFLLVSSHT